MPTQPDASDTESDKPNTLPAFTPVPRAKERSNGWKPQVQRAFIEALAETGSVRAACRRVGRSDHGAYLLRRHPEAAEFRRAWDAALDIALRRIEDVAMDRALHGVEVPVYSYGKLVGTRTVYNDRLLMFILRNRAPERFAGGRSSGMNAIDRMELARLKKQWRAEWERERLLLDQQEEAETYAEIDDFIENIRLNRQANMSPRARAAYEEAKRIEEEDRAGWVAGGDAEDEQSDPMQPVLASTEVDETETKLEWPRVLKLTDERW